MKRFNRDSERGASLVEFALVGMIFFVFVFALIEASAAFFARNTIGLAASDGARAVSIRYQDGTASDEAAMKIISNRVGNAFGAKVERVIIYKAPKRDAIPSASCLGGSTAGGDCVIYKFSGGKAPLVSCSTGWCEDKRLPDDRIGVWIESNYEGLTGMNPFSFGWNDRSVNIIEPRIP